MPACRFWRWRAAVLLLGGCASAAASAEVDVDRLAMLPLRPLLASPEHVVFLQEELWTALFRGPVPSFRAVEENAVEQALRARRIRVVETLPAHDAVYLTNTLDGAGLLCGTLLYASDRPEPTAALLLRMFDGSGKRVGSILWAERASDWDDWLGLNAPPNLEALFRIAATTLRERLVERFESRPPRARTRIVVLPFDPAFEFPESGPLASVVAAHVLEEDLGFEVIEPGDLYDGFRRARVRNMSLLGLDAAQRLAQEVDTRWILYGTVLEFEQGSGLQDPPRAALILRLYDARENRTIESLSVSRSGDQGETVLRAGLTPHPIANLHVALRKGIRNLSRSWENP